MPDDDDELHDPDLLGIITILDIWWCSAVHIIASSHIHKCIDIIPSQPKTYFVIKMYSIVFIAKLDLFHSAALAAIFRVTIGALCSNSNETFPSILYNFRSLKSL